MNNLTMKVIKLLLGNAEWSITDEDLSTLVIYTESVKAPTQAEIDAAIEQIKASEAAEEAAKASAKAALLDRLGITEDEARLLLS